MEIFSLFIISLFCSTHLTNAKHILRPGESLNSNQSLVSQNGIFEFGFFSTASYTYVSIWFKDFRNYWSNYEPYSWYNDGQYVWIGNTEHLFNISQTYALSLSQNGDLILNQSQSHELFWSPNIEKSERISTILVLHDNGNLVLCDHTNSNEVIWQSFDHPTNTWLPGAWLGFSNINGKSVALSLVSWGSELDPSGGAYSLEIDQSTGNWGFVVTDIYRSIRYFHAFPSWLPIQYNHGLITINSTDGPRYFVSLNPEGTVNIWSLNGTRVTNLLYGDASCTLNCGPFGICVSNFSAVSCKCPYGFQPASPKEFSVQNFSSGCVRNVSWNCKTDFVFDSDNYRTFHQLDNVANIPYNIVAIEVLSQEDCMLFCLRDCSCVAFASRGNDCYPWYGELSGITIYENRFTGLSIYIRLAISNSPIKDTNTDGKNYKLIIGGVSIIVIACLLFIWILIRKFLCVKLVNVDGYLSVYTFRQMKNATKNFSTKLGEGGFGSVFKGRLFNCIEVAVKKLKVIGQEEKQFRTEVQTLGMIRHSNLVGLLGFCAEGKRRLLVYEYMSKGSLNSHIFKEGSNILSWKNRYKISVGIARGLAYLHEQCLDRIIHCDIKPENILLDEHFSPKIADFGLAKLLSRDFSRVLTTMRGTIGYLAPEWISGEEITEKADVYSYGMMLFEIISGKRNTSKFDNRRYPYFPLYATMKINEGEVLCLLDEKLAGNVNVGELICACKVAGWCIQDSEACRPSMGKVELMLQDVIDVGIPPVPHSLRKLVDAEDYQFNSSF
jgi:Protein kinase domain/D-mannose binding lectin/PAN-like domain